MLDFFKKIFNSNNNDNISTLIDDGATLVDVRTVSEYQRGHVQGSINIPLDSIRTNLGMLRNSKYIIVFCQSGNRSGQAKTILEQNGFTNVHNGGTWQGMAQTVASLQKLRS